jgi:hypothetical protein
MTMTRRHLTAAFVGLAAVAAANGARANGLATSAARPILTVSGKISGSYEDHTARFDRAALEALGTNGFTTTTPWYDGEVKFEGVLMTRLMEAIGATGDIVVATALNDCETKIPVSDFAAFKVLLALKRDGQYMPVHDKGPLFMVYPFDSNPVLKNQRYYGRSAWQLARLVFM